MHFSTLMSHTELCTTTKPILPTYDLTSPALPSKLLISQINLNNVEENLFVFFLMKICIAKLTVCLARRDENTAALLVVTGT